MGVVAAAHPNGLTAEVDVAPLQREELAQAQPREGGGQEQGAVLSRPGRTDQHPYLLGRECMQIVGDADAWAVDGGQGVQRQPPHLHRSPEDPMHDDEVLVDRAVGDGQGRFPLLDGACVRPRPQLAEGLVQSANRVAVVGQRAGLAGPLVLGPAQPLGRGVGEGGTGPAPSPATGRDGPRGQQIVQPRLRAPLGEVAGGRPTARPVHAGPMSFWTLAPVRGAGTWRTTGARGAARRGRRGRKWGSRGPPLAGYRTRFSGHIRDMLTSVRPFSTAAGAPRNRENPANTLHGAARNRTFQPLGLPGPAGFEDRMGHQTPAAPRARLRPDGARLAAQHGEAHGGRGGPVAGGVGRGHQRAVGGRPERSATDPAGEPLGVRAGDAPGAEGGDAPDPSAPALGAAAAAGPLALDRERHPCRLGQRVAEGGPRATRTPRPRAGPRRSTRNRDGTARGEATNDGASVSAPATIPGGCGKPPTGRAARSRSSRSRSSQWSFRPPRRSRPTSALDRREQRGLAPGQRVDAGEVGGDGVVLAAAGDGVGLAVAGQDGVVVGAAAEVVRSGRGPRSCRCPRTRRGGSGRRRPAGRR